MKIQPAQLSDAEGISALILALSEGFYVSPSREGAEPFLASIGTNAVRSRISAGNFTHWIATSDQQLAGVAALRDNSHLFHLFVALPFQGQGLSRQLWNLVKATAMQSGNPGEFTVNASLNAIPVYERFGFVRERQVEQMHGISFQPMRFRCPTPQAATVN